MYPVSQEGRWREANRWTPNQTHHHGSWRSTSPSKRRWNENSYQSINAYNSLTGQQLRSQRHWSSDRTEQHYRQGRQRYQAHNKDHRRKNDYEKRHNEARTRQPRSGKQQNEESFARMGNFNTRIRSVRPTNPDEHKHRSERDHRSEHDHRLNTTLEKGVNSIHSCSVISSMSVTLPSTADILSSKADILPRNVDALPSNADELPSKVDTMSSRVDILPSMADALPIKTDTLPSKADILPSKAVTLPSKIETLPNMADSLPTMSDIFKFSSDSNDNDDQCAAEKPSQELLSSDSKCLMNITLNENSEELFSLSTKQSSIAAYAQSISRKTLKNDDDCSQTTRLHDQSSHIPDDCIHHPHSSLFENIVKRQPIVLIQRLTSFQIRQFCSKKRTARKSFSETTNKSAHVNKALTLKLKRQISNDAVSFDEILNIDADSLAETYTICKTVKSHMKNHDNIKCHVDPKVKIFSKLINSASTETEHCQTSKPGLGKNVGKRPLIDRSKLFDGLCFKRRSPKHADRQSGRTRMWKHMAMRNFSVAPRFSSEKKYQTHKLFQDEAHKEATSPLAGTLPFQHSNTEEVSGGNDVKLHDCQHAAPYKSHENGDDNTLKDDFYPLQTALCSNDNENVTKMQRDLPVLVGHESRVLSYDSIINVAVSNSFDSDGNLHSSETKHKTGDTNFSTLSREKMLKSVIVSYNPVSMCISSTRPKSPVDSLPEQGGSITRRKSEQKSEHFPNEETKASQPLQKQVVVEGNSYNSFCSTMISDLEEHPWNQTMFTDTQNRTGETLYSDKNTFDSVQREQCEMNAPVCLISEVHSMASVPSHSISGELFPKDGESGNTNNIPTEKVENVTDNGDDGDFADLQMATEALLNLQSAGLTQNKHVDSKPVDDIVAQPISSNTESDLELSTMSICRSNSAYLFDSAVPEDDAESVVVPQLSLTIDTVIPAEMSSEASGLPDQSPYRPLSDSSVILDDVTFTNSSLDEEQQTSPITHCRLVLEETSSPCESVMSDEGYIKGEDLMFHEDHGHSRSSEETILYSDSDEGAKSNVNSTDAETISDCLYKSLSEESVFHNDLQIVDQTLEFPGSEPEEDLTSLLVIDDRPQQMNVKPFIKRRLRNKIQNKQKSKKQEGAILDPKSKTSQICPLPKIMTRIKKLNQRVDQYVKQYNVHEKVPKRTKLQRKKKQTPFVKNRKGQIGKTKRRDTKKQDLLAKEQNRTTPENSEDPWEKRLEKLCPDDDELPTIHRNRRGRRVNKTMHDMSSFAPRKVITSSERIMREFPNHNWLEQKYAVPSDVRVSSSCRKDSIDSLSPESTDKDTSLELRTQNTMSLSGGLSVETNLSDNNSAPLLSSNGSTSAEGSLSLRLSPDENSCSSQTEIRDVLEEHLEIISHNAGVVDMTYKCLETVEPIADITELSENNVNINRELSSPAAVEIPESVNEVCFNEDDVKYGDDHLNVDMQPLNLSSKQDELTCVSSMKDKPCLPILRVHPQIVRSVSSDHGYTIDSVDVNEQSTSMHQSRDVSMSVATNPQNEKALPPLELSMSANSDGVASTLAPTIVVDGNITEQLCSSNVDLFEQQTTSEQTESCLEQSSIPDMESRTCISTLVPDLNGPAKPQDMSVMSDRYMRDNALSQGASLPPVISPSDVIPSCASIATNSIEMNNPLDFRKRSRINSQADEPQAKAKCYVPANDARNGNMITSRMINTVSKHANINPALLSAEELDLEFERHLRDFKRLEELARKERMGISIRRWKEDLIRQMEQMEIAVRIELGDAYSHAISSSRNASATSSTGFASPTATSVSKSSSNTAVCDPPFVARNNQSLNPDSSIQQSCEIPKLIADSNPTASYRVMSSAPETKDFRRQMSAKMQNRSKSIDADPSSGSKNVYGRSASLESHPPPAHSQPPFQTAGSLIVLSPMKLKPLGPQKISQGTRRKNHQHAYRNASLAGAAGRPENTTGSSTQTMMRRQEQAGGGQVIDLTHDSSHLARFSSPGGSQYMIQRTPEIPDASLKRKEEAQPRQSDNGLATRPFCRRSAEPLSGVKNNMHRLHTSFGQMVQNSGQTDHEQAVNRLNVPSKMAYSNVPTSYPGSSPLAVQMHQDQQGYTIHHGDNIVNVSSGHNVHASQATGPNLMELQKLAGQQNARLGHRAGPNVMQPMMKSSNASNMQHSSFDFTANRPTGPNQIFNQYSSTMAPSGPSIAGPPNLMKMMQIQHQKQPQHTFSPTTQVAMPVRDNANMQWSNFQIEPTNCSQGTVVMSQGMDVMQRGLAQPSWVKQPYPSASDAVAERIKGMRESRPITSIRMALAARQQAPQLAGMNMQPCHPRTDFHQDSMRTIDSGRALTAFCLRCQAPATSICSGCKKAGYCGQRCQLSHWAEHSRNCVAHKLETSMVDKVNPNVPWLIKKRPL